LRPPRITARSLAFASTLDDAVDTLPWQLLLAAAAAAGRITLCADVILADTDAAFRPTCVEGLHTFASLRGTLAPDADDEHDT